MLAHGGAIKYELRETGGTVFRMTF
jgi:hypothetical protein